MSHIHVYNYMCVSNSILSLPYGNWLSSDFIVTFNYLQSYFFLANVYIFLYLLIEPHDVTLVTINSDNHMLKMTCDYQ